MLIIPSYFFRFSISELRLLQNLSRAKFIKGGRLFFANEKILNHISSFEFACR